MCAAHAASARVSAHQRAVMRAECNVRCRVALRLEGLGAGARGPAAPAASARGGLARTDSLIVEYSLRPHAPRAELELGEPPTMHLADYQLDRAASERRCCAVLRAAAPHHAPPRPIVAFIDHMGNGR